MEERERKKTEEEDALFYEWEEREREIADFLTFNGFRKLSF